MSEEQTLATERLPMPGAQALAERAAAGGLPVFSMPDVHARWSAARLVGFRFACAYFVLYLLPFPLGSLPGLRLVGGWWDALMQAVAPWVGGLVFRVEGPVLTAVTGSGDRLYDYLLNFCILLAALLAAVVWTVLDRRREHARLREWVRLYVRLGLGFIMITYGGAKVIKSQFPMAGLDALAQPLGEYSPMGLLWAFMGFSPAYNLFTGLGELAGGALLFYKRTTLAGALLLITVLSNVVILNFAYDVPVKIYSANLLLMALWLAANDGKRLLNVLWWNRTAEPARDVALFASAGRSLALSYATTGFLVFSTITVLATSLDGLEQYGDNAPKPPLYGLYDATEFVRNGVVLPPLLGDGVRWRRATFNKYGGFTLLLMNDSVRQYRAVPDTVGHTVALILPRDTTQRLTLAYARPAPETLVLSGLFGGDTIRATFHRLDDASFLLLNRGYHWIQERPFNRQGRR